MKDYFAVLEISTEASTKDIKQAYFKMIRKYHPDRYPEEFMKIREAYETLSNEQTREEYREFAQMDDFIKLNLKRAIAEMEEENYEYAIAILSELIRHRRNNIVLQSYLGAAYLKNDNTGNAIKVFESLVKKVPEHAGFAGSLAKAYLERGWHKKAIEAFNKALALDDDNVSLWIGLAEAYMDNRDYQSAKKVLQKALEIGKEKDWDKLTIYHYLFNLAMQQEEYGELISYIKEIKGIIPDQEEATEHLAWLVMNIGAELLHKGEAELAEKLFEEIYQVIPNNKKLKEFGYTAKKIIPLEDELSSFMQNHKVYDDIKILIQAEVYPLEKMGFHGKNKETYKKLLCMEVAIGYKQCKSSLRILENKYPKLYELKKEFFNKMKDKTQRELFISHNDENKKDFEKLISLMRKNDVMGIKEEEFDDLDDVDIDDAFMDEYFGEKQEPYVREQAKVGRNDPCPCGSGKKYKQCCGR